MEQEPGDEYLRTLAAFIRNNEKGLAEAGIARRRRPQRPTSEPASVFNPLGWFGLESSATTAAPFVKPIILSLDTHHLFYVLMRLEALGIDIGTLDVQVDSPSRPMSYVNLFPGGDKSETLSLASFRSSFSTVSGLSLGGGWWGRAEPLSMDTELKFIYSSFTKLPALSVNAPGRKIIAELANEPPNQNALPLDAFKNLQSFECVDIDPRTLLGWDRLAESLRSLKIRKSGLEDIGDIFIGAVVDDQARREGSTSRKRHRRIPRGSLTREISFYSTQLPDSVPEDPSEEDSPVGDGASSPVPSTKLSSLKWAFLKHLALPDNALTFLPAEIIPYLTSLTHLDLSSNLLVSVPSGLSALYNLISLNLSDNMIDSVLGIYLNLGQVLQLNLSRNRLESICGLERLLALERVDLRSNIVEESAEIGRLATLPNIAEVWVEGNPFTEFEENYRIACFDFFWKEGKNILLDGTPPGFYERRNLTIPPPEQMSSSRPVSTAYSPPVVAVGSHSHPHHQSHASPSLNVTSTSTDSPPPSSAPSHNPSPLIGPLGVGVGGKARRKKNKRIVELDGDRSDGSTGSHSRMRSDGSSRARANVVVKKDEEPSPTPVTRLPKATRAWSQFGQLAEDAQYTASFIPQPKPVREHDSEVAVLTAPTDDSTKASFPPRPSARSRHGRSQTEFAPALAFGESSIPTQSTSKNPSPPSSTLRNTPSRRPTLGSATISSKLTSRRARVSASVYEPPMSVSDNEDSSATAEIKDTAEAYRKRLEALRQDMGDGWLKVFTQSQMNGGLTSS